MNEKGISLAQLRQRKTRQTAALFLAPVIILLVVFIAYPIIDTFITSGYQWNGISADKKMIGLANWAKLIKDTKFWTAFKNNVIIMILSIIIQIPLGLAMATFLDFGGKKLTIFKVIWFIPMLMSSVAIGFLFTYALATNGGIVSTISHWFGGGNIDLLGNPKLALITVILIIAWQFTPFYMVYFMAGYTNIPYDVFEAARIDGANHLKIFFRVILPIARPMIIFLAITSFTGPWMDWIFPKMVLGQNEKYTLAIGLISFIDGTRNQFTLFAAGALVICIPFVIFFIISQKAMTTGLGAAAVKE